MAPTGRLDMSRLDAALRGYVPTTRRDRAEIVNQRALNVMGRTFDLIPPASGAGVEGKRAEIKAYMDEPILYRLKVFKSGKRKGKTGARGQPLMRKHLIAQARRKKRGLKGLYGWQMRKASAGLSRRAQVSVGFLKSLFLPVIRALNPLVPFKFPFAKTRNISRWPNSAGHGIASPAKPGARCLATIVLSLRMKLGNNAKAMSIVESNLQKAVNEEAGELERHTRAKLAERARQAGWRQAA
jgi:hypothetical protein